jgi:ElaB/YqjD/DUF883 family membrane-anchored ribosome-binding protein
MSTEEAVRDARKAARDVQSAASDKFADVQDELIDFAQHKPLTALLSAFAIGVVVGKVVL